VVVIAADHADAVFEAARLLDAGELVVVPTDTAYALCADALDDDAVARVFHAKARPADRPLAVLLGGMEDAGHVGFPTPLARQLAERFWPGPLTLVVRARPWLPDALTAGGETVALRCPDLAFPRELARHFGPLVLTGARRAGGPDCVGVAEARAAMGAEAGLYVDGGTLPGGRATVVDATGQEAKVLSGGKLPAAEVAQHGRSRD
jgi:tRNA threonylcarbamoyl adenosine modification protein (Sua5/YciO/YrdC/YwlC family)